MNAEQYGRVCEACDRVLLEPSSTLERVAIPWLHVVREHPVFLENYSDLFNSSKCIKALVRHCLRHLRNIAVGLRQIVRALRSSGVFWFEAAELPNDVDVLFVSHLLTEAHACQVDDFYFGDLPAKLAEQGLTVVVALINHTRTSGAKLVGALDQSRVPRIILSESLGIRDELGLYRRLRKESRQLRRLASNEGAGLLRKVLMRASQEALANSNLRIAVQISALMDRLDAKAIAVTHEGHAWERLAFAAARNSRATVCCIGYQHAALFRLQHAIRRRLLAKYNPDRILTAGTVSKAQLDGEPSLAGTDVSVLGSNRVLQFDVCDPGSEPKTSSEDRPIVPACLVVPEGIPSECHVLFEFALACARRCSEIRFIWRLHPLMMYRSLAANNPKLRDLPGNVVISTSSFVDDIKRCQWVLYRGSTAAIQAVAAGLQPIYLALSDEMTIDPLYEIEHYGTKVATAAQFRRATVEQECQVPIHDGVAPDYVRKYCQNFYQPFDYKLIPKIVSQWISVN